MIIYFFYMKSYVIQFNNWIIKRIFNKKYAHFRLQIDYLKFDLEKMLEKWT